MTALGLLVVTGCRRRIRLYYCFVGAIFSWIMGYNLLYHAFSSFHTNKPLDERSAQLQQLNLQRQEPLITPTTKQHHPLDSIASNRKDLSQLPHQQDRRRTPTHHACDGYDGILHIQMGDIGGAAGTIFFQFVIGQILYAERTNLKPWIHFNNVSYVVYDNTIHGNPNIPPTTFKALVGKVPSILRRPNGHWRDAIPGPLINSDNTTTHQQQTFQFTGTGVWEHYFDPISDFVPGDESCANQYYVTLDLVLITPGIHGFADWAPSCWRYQYLPDYITQPHIPLTEWLEPQRHIAARVAQQYIRFQPYLVQQAQQVNPQCSNDKPCLGLHIRHSDKAAGRIQIQTSEFLPYAQAFVNSGGRAIYVATDSWHVLHEIQSTWPHDVVSIIRTIDNSYLDHGILVAEDNNNSTTAAVVRSKDDTAVFDIAATSHHETNRQVLIEILALSQCQFLIHGLSAVSEAAIWLNRDGIGDNQLGLGLLHNRSVNLEDPTHMTVAEFGTLVTMVLRKDPIERWPPPSARTNRWWDQAPAQDEVHQLRPLGVDNRSRATSNIDEDCTSYRGVLHIAAVGNESSAGAAFFTHVVNQLLYAEQNQLLPWIHLNPILASNLYDAKIHATGTNDSSVTSIQVRRGTIGDIPVDFDTSDSYPGPPNLQPSPELRNYDLIGNGIWGSYFEPVSSWSHVRSSQDKPLVTLEQSQVSPGLDSLAPWSVKAWRYDSVPDHAWKLPPVSSQTSSPEKLFMEPMRRKGHGIVKKYMQFLPYIQRQAENVNPGTDQEPCLAVHFRNGDKAGRHRTKVTSEKFLPYMESFVDAGGKCIYVASDSHRVLQYISKNFPERVRAVLRSQGDHVVRSTKERNSAAKGWPTHMIGEHHRVNAETLVDVLAMSKCQLLLHTHSTVSEAAIYVNLDLHHNSVNLEDPYKLTPGRFRALARRILRQHREQRTDATSDSLALDPTVSTEGGIDEIHLDNATIIKSGIPARGKCRTNAVVYLAQKHHSSYRRDSYTLLLRSLGLLHQNYLSNPRHMDNTDVFIFHTGDFNQSDLGAIETQLGDASRGAIHLVDLTHSIYWARPRNNAKDNPKTWYAFPQFSEGYRRMIHLYAIDIWRFFANYNAQTGCNYRYILRLDEDSYIHSPISYDVFDFFQANQYFYGYRMCSYEMKVAQRMWQMWKKHHPEIVPQRELDLDMCGFYNNFFVADLEFFNSPPVSAFLKFIDRQGHIYRRRLGDLMIHTMAVIAFAPASRIHRFLDFTYEHGTYEDGCLAWGGIQAGYNDPRASLTLNDYYQTMTQDRNCRLDVTFLQERDLSPSYSHISPGVERPVLLHTIVRGWVENSTGLGLLSG